MRWSVLWRYATSGRNDVQEQGRGHEVDSGHVDAISLHPRPYFLSSASTKANRTHGCLFRVNASGLGNAE
jgi:hypothetical protein